MDTDRTTLFAAEVRHGAALLDERKPGWIDQIDLELLDVSSCFRCVLGQVFSGGPYGNGFTSGLMELGISEDAESYGFAAFDEEDSSYQELTDAWVSYIAERRAS